MPCVTLQMFGCAFLSFWPLFAVCVQVNKVRGMVPLLAKGSKEPSVSQQQTETPFK